MNQLIIIYEFLPENTEKLIPFKNMIRKYGQFAFVTNNSCIIWTEDTAVTVRDNLKTGLGSGDKLYIGGTAAPAAWMTTVSQEVTDYLQKNLK
jgi:hypothetical protein